MTGLPKTNYSLSSHPTVGTSRLRPSIAVALVAAVAIPLQLGCQPTEQPAVPQLTTPMSDQQPVAEQTKEEQPADSQTTIDPYQWQDLVDGKTLDGWKITKFGGEGEVYVKDGTIVMEMGSYATGITWTGQPPRENFEIQLEGMRLSGSDFFCTTTMSPTCNGWDSAPGSSFNFWVPRSIAPSPLLSPTRGVNSAAA